MMLAGTMRVGHPIPAPVARTARLNGSTERHRWTDGWMSGIIGCRFCLNPGRKGRVDDAVGRE